MSRFEPEMTATLRSLLQRVGSLERYASSGKFIDFTPTLTGSTADPNLGATGTATGRYTRHGDWTFAIGDIRFAGAGVAAGTGDYRIGLPAPGTAATTSGTFTVLGHWRCTNGLGSSFKSTDILVGTSAAYMTCRYPLTYPTGTDTVVGAAAPWAWAAGYRISFAVMYEAAP